MALTNNLRKQVDLPVWEWARFAPAVSAATSCSCTADNGQFHVSFGRYIYYFISSTSFWRYDTWTDTYMQLASAPITAATWTSMRFGGSRGYEGRVISATNSTFTAAGVFGNQLKSFDVRIVGGTGVGQQRIITSVADPVIADYGTASAATALVITDSTKAWQINQWVGYQIRITFSTGVSQVRRIMYNTATTITVADVNKYAEDPNCNAQFSALAPLAAPAAGSTYQIESSVFTVDSNWGTNPDATSRFMVMSGGIYLMSSQATSNFSFMYYDVIADVWYIKTANSGPLPTAGTDGTLERCTENSTVWDRGSPSAVAGAGVATLTDSTKNWTVNQWAGYYVRIFSGTGEGLLRVISSNTSTVLTVGSNWGGSGIDATSKYLIVGYDAGTATSAGSESQTASGTASSIAGNVLTVGGSITGTFIPGMILSGTGVSVPQFFNGTNTSSGAVITTSSTTNVNVGQVMTMITGTGTLSGITTVIAVNTSTTFTVSTAPSVALAGTNTFILSGGGTVYTSAAGATSSSTTVTVGSTANLRVGMMVMVTAGTGTFASATTVTAVNSATTFTVSTTPSVALSGGASVVVGTWPLQTILGTQISGTVGGAGTYYVYPQQTVSSTTITGTGVATLTDTSKTGWTTNRWNNMAVRITGGTGKGQVRTIQGTYQTGSAGIISVVPNWTTTPDNTSTYEIQGDPDNMYMMFGASAQTFNYHIGADTITTGRMEDWGAAAGVTVRYSDHPPLAVASGSYANPTMTITTVNNHNLKTGMTVTVAGDTGAGASLNNISATITVTGATTFTYSVGAGSANITVTAQSTTTLTDASKSWITNQFAGSILTYNTAQVAQATGIAAASSVYVIANTSNTLFFAAAGTAPTQGVSRYVITSQFQLPYKSTIGALDGGLAVGTQSTTTLVDTTKLWTSPATSCASSGTTITVTGTGNVTSGLQVGMYLAVTAGTGAFVSGAGTNTTSVTVTAILSATTFSVSATPSTTLSGATVTATFWPTSAFVNRKLKFLGGTGQYQELTITANTNTTLTFALSTAGATGSTPYVILQNPVRGTGMELLWASGMTDTTRRGSYLFAARGGAVLGFDRLNIQTDSWDLMSTSPQFETLTTGSMYAYDGGDRIYFTKEVTQRMYYLDIDKSTIHGAGIYPYTAGSTILGNRMEIFQTADGLKYLWLNRHGNVECFKQLLFY